MTESTFLIFSTQSDINQSVSQSINQSGITPSYISYSYIGIFAVLLNELHKPWHPCHPATLPPFSAQVVAETMVTLGMSAHTDRLLRLLVENGVTNTAVLERHLVTKKWDGRFRFVMSTPD